MTNSHRRKEERAQGVPWAPSIRSKMGPIRSKIGDIRTKMGSFRGVVFQTNALNPLNNITFPKAVSSIKHGNLNVHHHQILSN